MSLLGRTEAEARLRALINLRETILDMMEALK